MRPEATFCGQCYTDFRPAPPTPPPPAAPAPTATYSAPAADPLTAPLLDVVLPAGAVPAQGPVPAQGVPVVATAPVAKPGAPMGWPCTSCGNVNDFTAVTCSVCTSPFLAEVSESSRVTLVLPVVGDISRYSRGQRALIALGAILVVLVPLALVTLLLTHSPPSSGPTTPAPAGETITTTTG